MARTVVVFRDNMIERERLARCRRKQRRARAARRSGGGDDQAIPQFGRRALERLREALVVENASSDSTTPRRRIVGSARRRKFGWAEPRSTSPRCEFRSRRLAVSIGESRRRRRNRPASPAAPSPNRPARSTHVGTRQRRNRIGEVVGLIQAIAGQTNLLALNATSKRRAPGSRRGFAVVAAEGNRSRHRPHAPRGHRRPDRLDPIGDADAAQAIEQVSSIIDDMSEIATAVAATVDNKTMPWPRSPRAVNLARRGALRFRSDEPRRRASTARAQPQRRQALADAAAIEAENCRAKCALPRRRAGGVVFLCS